VPPRPVHDLAGFLSGAWEIHREIVPVRGTPPGGFEGTATFSPWRPGVLVYEEHGTVVLGGYTGTATRRLTYVVDGPRARVRFADGRFFHDLDLTTGRWETTHPCAADRYHGRFMVRSGDTWEQTWEMTGPGEAYRSRTVLVRVGSTAPSARSDRDGPPPTS
jgi:hypothetical protein